MPSKVAALYVDALRGPYAAIPGVDVYGIDRDATLYNGPWPIVAHPPCGHWGRLWHLCHDDGSTGPIAVAQVRTFGGVLEHPAHSKLWKACGMPAPNEFPDRFGGWTLAINQSHFGHRATKPTWIYVVGIHPRDVTLPPPVAAARPISSARKADGTVRGSVERMHSGSRHLTPAPLAAWLCDLARASATWRDLPSSN
jgi:hypothetical protein